MAGFLTGGLLTLQSSQLLLSSEVTHPLPFSLQGNILYYYEFTLMGLLFYTINILVRFIPSAQTMLDNRDKTLSQDQE